MAIIGSGPPASSAAAQLNQAGHEVTVFERDDRIGGLLMYGIPNMKLDKNAVVERRLDLLREEGIILRPGSPWVTAATAPSTPLNCMPITTRAARHRRHGTPDLPIPGRELKGIHFAMEFLTANTRSLLDSQSRGRQLHFRQGQARHRHRRRRHGHRLHRHQHAPRLPQPGELRAVSPAPGQRAPDNPWPTWPRIYRTDYGHEESAAKFGQDPRQFSISSTEFIDDGNGRVCGIRTVDVEFKDGKFENTAGSEREWPADLVFLAMGFLGPEAEIAGRLGVELDARSNYQAEYGKYLTNVEKVFSAGDCRRGQSLVVRAINEGREAAREIDRFLTGSTNLP